jgi:hypothetical protein
MGEAELTQSPNLEYKDPTAKMQDDTPGITISYHGQTTNRNRRTGYTAENPRIREASQDGHSVQSLSPMAL